MARYQIWNKTDDIYTPGREATTGKSRFTAAEWLERFPWAAIPGAKMIITTGIINGGVSMEFEQTKNTYKKMGANITNDMTDEEVLAAIEEFEDNPPAKDSDIVSTEERIAAALEAQVMMVEEDCEAVMTFSLDDDTNKTTLDGNEYSPAFKRVMRNYDQGLWSDFLVTLAVQKGHITAKEARIIIDGESV